MLICIIFLLLTFQSMLPFVDAAANSSPDVASEGAYINHYIGQQFNEFLFIL
jgi:hypothetical protein